MKKIVALILFCPAFSWAQICEVPKEKIVIADVYLGKSVSELAKQHNGITINSREDQNTNPTLGVVEFANDLDKYWLTGTPINSFIYISFNKSNKLITGYNIMFNLDDIEPKKFKNVLVEMYDLPKNGWSYKVDDSDPKYGEEYSFTYKCNDYTIYMSQSGFGSTMSINEN